MILKGAQRGGGKQLAQHLLATHENEHVEVHELRGFVSDDLTGAFKEAHAVSKGTRCKQFLFSVSLSPPPQERVGVEVFESAVDRIEERVGLKGHPRAIVFHEKEGRRHAHAVWSRIDAETMTAKNLPHFKLKLRDLSRELYIENGWKMPRGLMNSREADPRNFSLAEWHQAKRAGREPRDLKSLMQECWAASDSRAAFEQALKARGFTLARGDRRAHVALSPEGEVFSVARKVGKKAKEVEKRLGDAERLMSLREAKAQLSSDLIRSYRRHKQEAELEKRKDLAPLDTKRLEMARGQRLERGHLYVQQERRWAEETRARAARFEKGVRGLWDRLTGKHAATQKENELQAYAALARDRAQRQMLIDAQMKDRQTLQAEIKSVRDRHAALLRGLRTDQQQVKARLQEAAPAKPATPAVEAARPQQRQPSSLAMEQRLERMRNRETVKPVASAQQDHASRLDRLRDGSRQQNGPAKTPGRER